VRSNFRSYLTHYRTAFAYSNFLYLQGYSLSYDQPSFVTKGAFQAYHVPPFEHMDLAARYGPEDIWVTAKKLTPWLLPYLLYYGFSHLTGVDKSRSSTRVQMSSAYPLPGAYPDYGFQEDPPLAHRFPHLHALLLCPIRSLFRIVGSSSRMDGGIISLLSTTALLTTSCRTGLVAGRYGISQHTLIINEEDTCYP
jgi:hypothetical protein